MAKKTTLEDIAVQLRKMDTRMGKMDTRMGKMDVHIGKMDERIGKMDERMERGFAALTEDIADTKTELKGDIAGVYTQVNSIETEIRGMKRAKLEPRVMDLEEKVFGKARA